MLGKIKLWSCATCSVAFKGIDDFIESSTFQEPLKKGANQLCKLVNPSKDPEICPDGVQ